MKIKHYFVFICSVAGAYALDNLARGALATDTLSVTLAGQALVRNDARVSAPESFSEMRALLQGGDAVFTNLEAAIIGPKSEGPTRGPDLLHSVESSVLDSLKAEGFNLLALGNNHSWDLGTGGVVSTLDAADKDHWIHAGTGRTLSDASSPVYLITPHGKVALVAFASGKVGASGAATATRPGVNELRLDEKTKTLNQDDAARILASIKLAAANADCVIVYDHNHYWEESMADTPRWISSWAKACIDAGGSIFVSHGEPLMHGIEIYHGKPIFYNLGNFAFQTMTQEKWKGPEIWESVVARCSFQKGRLVSVSLVPLVLNEKGEDGARFFETRGWPRLATGASAQTVMKKMAELSAPYKTEFELEGDRESVVVPSN